MSIGDLSSRRTRERNSGRTRKENSKNEIPKQDEVNVGTRVLRTRKVGLFFSSMYCLFVVLTIWLLK